MPAGLPHCRKERAGLSDAEPWGALASSESLVNSFCFNFIYFLVTIYLWETNPGFPLGVANGFFLNYFKI